MTQMKKKYFLSEWTESLMESFSFVHDMAIERMYVLLVENYTVSAWRTFELYNKL